MFSILAINKRLATTNTLLQFQQQCRGMCSSSKGALSGGFTREGLEEYARELWKTTETVTDLSSQKLSMECTKWLDSHDDASCEIAQSYFGSYRFLPERLLISPLFFLSKQGTELLHLPNDFKVNDEFLAWKVVVKTPLETILLWENGKYKGLTMMAYDPRLQRLYHGNSMSVDNQTLQSRGFALLNQFHLSYAKFLLAGMANQLEQNAAKSLKGG